MITVCVRKKNGCSVGFEVHGHAGFAPEGGDIVCSAVSALTQTTALGLTELLHLDVGLTMEKGDMQCALGPECPAVQSERAALLIDTMALGLASIEDAYGRKYLTLTQKEV